MERFGVEGSGSEGGAENTENVCMPCAVTTGSLEGREASATGAALSSNGVLSVNEGTNSDNRLVVSGERDPTSRLNANGLLERSFGLGVVSIGVCGTGCRILRSMGTSLSSWDSSTSESTLSFFFLGE